MLKMWYCGNWQLAYWAHPSFFRIKSCIIYALWGMFFRCLSNVNRKQAKFKCEFNEWRKCRHTCSIRIAECSSYSDCSEKRFFFRQTQALWMENINGTGAGKWLLLFDLLQIVPFKTRKSHFVFVYFTPKMFVKCWMHIPLASARA